jgi:type IV pilus assembly protein PilC
MAVLDWKWEGTNKTGNTVKGVDKVDNERELKKILRGRGIRPTKITPPSLFDIDLGQWLLDQGIGSAFGAKELLNFTKQLSVLISSGIPIIMALEIIFRQEKNLNLKNVIKKISNDIGSGKSLSEALFAQKGFDKLYCNLIKAGEVGGVLDTILLKLTVYLEKSEKIKSDVKSALTYPSIVIFVGGIVIYLMLVFVVPQFTSMLTESNQEIPAITQFVIDTSNWLQMYTPIVVPILIVFFIFFMKFTKTPVGKPIWDQFTMEIPLFGNVIIKGSLSSTTRTLSTMLSSGVSLIDSLEICILTTENYIIANDLRKIKKSVESGKSLNEPFAKIKYIPDMTSQMIKIGEQTGKLDQMLERIADIFEKDVEDTIGNITKLIEPLILVVLGGIIALILVAMYMPIFMSAGGGGES